MKSIKSYIKENNDGPVEKGLYFEDGKKANGHYPNARVQLMALNADDTLTALNWKEYKALNVKDNLTDHAKNVFITALSKGLRNFGAKIDFNTFMRNKKPSFEETVDWLLKNGCKYTKRGLKVD